MSSVCEEELLRGAARLFNITPDLILFGEHCIEFCSYQKD